MLLFVRRWRKEANTPDIKRGFTVFGPFTDGVNEAKDFLRARGYVEIAIDSSFAGEGVELFESCFRDVFETAMSGNDRGDDFTINPSTQQSWLFVLKED